MWRQPKKTLTVVGALLLTALGAAPAAAQEFPTKQPIRIVVGANAGGLTDVLARVTAEYLQRRIGQAVVVENKPGAAGVIAADFVSKSPADGYTLFVANADFTVVPAVRTGMPYKYDEFTFLVRGFSIQPLMMVGPKIPVSSIPELVAYMKANPGKIRYATSGVGSTGHLGTAAFAVAAGVKGVHVPYTGIAPAYQDLLAGNIEFTATGTAPFPEGIKVIGSIGTKRSPLYPNLATLAESGINNGAWDATFGFIAPANLPKPIADRLTAELSAVLKDPEAIAKYQSSIKVVPETNPLVGDAFKKQVVLEYMNWKATAEREKIVVNP